MKVQPGIQKGGLDNFLPRPGIFPLASFATRAKESKTHPNLQWGYLSWPIPQNYYLVGGFNPSEKY